MGEKVDCWTLHRVAHLLNYVNKKIYKFKYLIFNASNPLFSTFCTSVSARAISSRKKFCKIEALNGNACGAHHRDPRWSRVFQFFYSVSTKIRACLLVWSHEFARSQFHSKDSLAPIWMGKTCFEEQTWIFNCKRIGRLTWSILDIPNKRID
jgi:hypothetical protein